MSRRQEGRPNKTNRMRKREAERRDAVREQRWGRCEVCEQHLPIVPETGMCGPCTFGDSSTLLGMEDD